MDKIVCILLILLLLCIMYYTFDCGCYNGVNGFSVGGQTCSEYTNKEVCDGPCEWNVKTNTCSERSVFCNPNVEPKQFCPNGIPCPRCGTNLCECPKSPKPSLPPSPPSPSPPPPPPPPGPSSDLRCVHSDFKGICIDDHSATIDPNYWFGKDASKFKWPLTNDPIEVIRTYNWNDMKEWVLWALKNDIKVLIGTASFDNYPTLDEINILKKHQDKIIAISPVNEGSEVGPTFDFLSSSIPRINSNLNGASSTNNPPILGVSNDIVAVNVYGLYMDMCCCDGNQGFCDCIESKQDNTLQTQNNFNFENVFIQSINGIQKYTRVDAPQSPWGKKFWVTEYGWESQYSNKDDPKQGPKCSDPQKYINRKKEWANLDNYKTTYKNFLNFNYDNVNDRLYYPIEYVFWFSLCDMQKKGEYFGLYDSTTPLPLPKF